MRLALVLVVMATTACVTGEPARRNRWPTHRKDKDQKIEELLTRVDKLEKEFVDLQAALAKAHAAPPAAPAAAPPAPSAP